MLTRLRVSISGKGGLNDSNYLSLFPPSLSLLQPVDVSIDLKTGEPSLRDHILPAFIQRAALYPLSSYDIPCSPPAHDAQVQLAFELE